MTVQMIGEALEELLQKAKTYCNLTEAQQMYYGIAVDGAIQEMRDRAPEAPIFRDGKIYCGWCNRRIPRKIKAHYCHKCGKEILWNEGKRLR